MAAGGDTNPEPLQVATLNPKGRPVAGRVIESASGSSSLVAGERLSQHPSCLEHLAKAPHFCSRWPPAGRTDGRGWGQFKRPHRQGVDSRPAPDC